MNTPNLTRTIKPVPSGNRFPDIELSISHDWSKPLYVSTEATLGARGQTIHLTQGELSFTCTSPDYRELSGGGDTYVVEAGEVLKFEVPVSTFCQGQSIPSGAYTLSFTTDYTIWTEDSIDATVIRGTLTSSMEYVVGDISASCGKH